MALPLVLRSMSRFPGSCSTQFAGNFRSLNTANLTTKLFPLKNTPAQTMICRKLTLSAPRLSAATGHHSKLWTAERFLSAALLGIVPAAVMFPSQTLDGLLAVSIVMHSHWGLEAIVVDYVRPILFGHLVPKLAHGLLIAFSAATLAGLFYFIYNDVGIGKAVRKLWEIKAQ